MKVANFGPLQDLGNLRPEDYVNYLQMISARNKGVKKPQLHATISAKGKGHDKQELTAIAVDWLDRMGYAEQPYLIVFHKDTGHNHVHVVTTRIDRNGRKISSAFEHNRAIQNLNKVLGLDEEYSAKRDLDKALAYSFGTKAQFLMILESMGYKLKEVDGKLVIIKFGKQQADLSVGVVLDKVQHYQPKAERRAQLKAIFHKYSLLYSTTLYEKEIPLPGGSGKVGDVFTSAFAEYLKEKMGIQLLFHGKDGKLPYGYSILDHSAKTVWKGGEIMTLAELLGVQSDGRFMDVDVKTLTASPVLMVCADVREYYQALLKAALHNYPDFRHGLNELQLTVTETPKGWMLTDETMNIAIPVKALLPPAEMQDLRESYSPSADHVYIPPVSIADDVDDQQIHGMRRRRQRKARTNTR